MLGTATDGWRVSPGAARGSSDQSYGLPTMKHRTDEQRKWKQTAHKTHTHKQNTNTYKTRNTQTHEHTHTHNTHHGRTFSCTDSSSSLDWFPAAADADWAAGGSTFISDWSAEPVLADWPDGVLSPDWLASSARSSSSSSRKVVTPRQELASKRAPP